MSYDIIDMGERMKIKGLKSIEYLDKLTVRFDFKSTSDPLVGLIGFSDDANKTVIERKDVNTPSSTNFLDLVSKLEVMLDNLSAKLDWQTPESPVSAGNSSAVLIAENLQRRAIIISNNGNRDVWLGLNTAAVVDEGIMVEQDSSIFIPPSDISTQVINLIKSSGGSASVTVQEAI